MIPNLILKDSFSFYLIFFFFCFVFFRISNIFFLFLSLSFRFHSLPFVKDEILNELINRSKYCLNIVDIYNKYYV